MKTSSTNSTRKTSHGGLRAINSWWRSRSPGSDATLGVTFGDLDLTALGRPPNNRLHDLRDGQERAFQLSPSGGLRTSTRGQAVTRRAYCLLQTAGGAWDDEPRVTTPGQRGRGRRPGDRRCTRSA